MKVLKGYNSAANAKRRLLAVVGEDEVFNNPKGDKNEKAKVIPSGDTRTGYDGINRLLMAIGNAYRTRTHID